MDCCLLREESVEDAAGAHPRGRETLQVSLYGMSIQQQSLIDLALVQKIQILPHVPSELGGGGGASIATRVGL